MVTNKTNNADSMTSLEIVESIADVYHAIETILVADVVESVRLTGTNEADFIRRWRAVLDRARTEAVLANQGRLVKATGDGLMAVFASPRTAIQAAFMLHSLASRGSEGVAAGQEIRLRVGVHVGDVTGDDIDIYGSDVNVAARLVTVAGPAETIASAEVRDRLTAEVDAQVEDLGECFFKHVTQPIRAYRIGLPGRQPVIRRGTGQAAHLKPTIAVVPFDARTPSPEHNVIGEILADDAISTLSRSALLNVVSRLSSAAFRGRGAEPTQVAAVLGAQYVLSGAYRVNGQEIALYAELADARSNQVVWADTLPGDLKSVLAPSNEMVTRLVEELSRAVLLTELRCSEGRALPTLDTYTLLMSAIALMHRSLPRDFERSRLMLEAVIERAPRHATPYAWLAKWHVMRLQQGGAGDPSAAALAAQDCIRRALDSDPGCSLALGVDGFINTNLLRRLDAGEKCYRRALEINPNDSLAWLLLGTLHAFKGEGKVALDATRHAQRLSPLDPLGYFYDSLSATAALAAGDWQVAIELARRSLRANRTHTSTWRALAIAQVQQGLVDEARTSVVELMRIDPGFTLERFVERSPSTGYAFGEMCRASLAAAGAPD